MDTGARKIFTDNLRRIMEQRGVTQTELARRINRSVPAVHDWCTGRRYPRVDCMQQLADALQVRMSDLTGEPKKQTTTGASFRNFDLKLTDEEMILIAEYRTAKPEFQAAALDILRAHKREESSALTGT